MEAAIQAIWVVMGLIFGFVMRYLTFAAFPGRMASATKWAVVALTALPMVVVMMISTSGRTEFLIGAGAGFLLGWVMALAGRRRRDAMLNRAPLSDEVADQHYSRMLRLRRLSLEVQRARNGVILFAVVAAGAVTLLTWLQSSLRQSDGQPWVAWVAAGFVTLSALAIATVLLLPVILAAIEYWHSTALTADEYRAADARLVGTRASRGSDPGTPGPGLLDTEGN